VDPSDQALASAVGLAVSAARARSGLTMAVLAQRAKVSQPFLSQVENGRAMPSLASLYRIARALGLTVQALLDTDHVDERISVVRAHEGRAVSDDAGFRERFLIPGQRLMQSGEVTASPGSDSGQVATHQGEELLYVISGRVRMEFDGDEPVTLSAGDLLYYPATIAHRWFAVGDQPTRFLFVHTPPGF
jgi:transcriptional regulator with XRE-family HTH domain